MEKGISWRNVCVLTLFFSVLLLIAHGYEDASILQGEQDSATGSKLSTFARAQRIRRTAVFSDDQLWTNATIRYIITDSIAVHPKLVRAIKDSIRQVETRTCIRFDNVSVDEFNATAGRYVEFVLGRTCQSHVGMLAGNGPQNVSLSTNCAAVNFVLHEIGHLLGLWHEHTRTDRNNNVLVLLKNVRPHHAYNFDTMENMRLLAPYDLSSLMHYDVMTMSTNGERTMQPLHDDLSHVVGYRSDFSFYDGYTLNTLYHCSDHCPENITCLHGGYLDKNCVCVCPSRIKGSRCQFVDTHAKCGGVIYLTNETEVEVTSPGYPRFYPNKIRCTWLIATEPGSVLTLRVPEFDVEKSSRGICRDELEVRYHHVGLQQGPKFCGLSFDRNITSTSHVMLLHFQSNSRRRRNGFRAIITRINATDCSSSPCLNNGSCSEDAPIGTYHCACVGAWMGHNCDIYITDGEWSEWSEWSYCVAQCGRRDRYRTCTNPAPQNGGRECTGNTLETKQCGDPKLCNSSFTCDFGKGVPGEMCNIDQENNLDDLAWHLTRGETSSLNTGPATGHTTGDRHDNYLYVEGSDGIDHETSVVWLPRRRTGRYCFQFYYHMRGSSMGTMAIIKRVRNKKYEVLWQRTGHQGDRWLRANLDVFFYSNLQICIGAVRGSGYESDFAVDDISISKRSCEFTHKEGERPRYGCAMDGKRYGKGPFNVTVGCIQKRCFCNQDGYVDCPEWRNEDVCKKTYSYTASSQLRAPKSYYSAQKLSANVRKPLKKYVPYRQRKKTSRRSRRRRLRAKQTFANGEKIVTEKKKPFWLSKIQ